MCDRYSSQGLSLLALHTRIHRFLRVFGVWESNEEGERANIVGEMGGAIARPSCRGSIHQRQRNFFEPLNFLKLTLTQFNVLYIKLNDSCTLIGRR